MSRPPLALLLVFTLTRGAIHGAEPAPTPATPATPPAPTAAAATGTLSVETAAKLVAARPKLPPLILPGAPIPAAETPDLREADKPQNGIVRLPKFVVREARPPVFREQDLYRSGDLARHLAKRYYSEGYLAFSKLVGYTPLALIFPSAEASAMARFEEDERLRNKAEFTEYAIWLKTSNPAAGAKLKNAAQETFMHWSDLGWSSKPN
jgi:hypothetical protein